MILLDLHLPDLSGEQVLAELKAEPVTVAIPVVVPFDLAEVAELLRSAAVVGRDQQACPQAHERVQPPMPTTSA